MAIMADMQLIFSKSFRSYWLLLQKVETERLVLQLLT